MTKKRIEEVKPREAVVDLKEALRYYEYKNDGEKLEKREICKSTAVSYQTMLNYTKNGSKILGFVLNLHEITGYPLDKIIKDLKTEENG